MDSRMIREVLKGLGSYVPGLLRLRKKATGGTDLADYCYSVWLRHLSVAHEHGLDCHPRVVVELGPGDSLGTGLAALLSGASRYYALDVVPFANVARNLEVLDQLLAMFQARRPIPDDAQFPNLAPRLASYEFPHDILPPDRLEEALAPARVERIRAALAGMAGPPGPDIAVSYVVPWSDPAVVPASSADMVLSQAVMQYVEDFDQLYRNAWQWLRPGGFMSHQIAFTSHNHARSWNGHWAYSDLVWKLIRGRRKPVITGTWHSAQVESMRRAGFTIIADRRKVDRTGVARGSLARRHGDLSDEDLETAGAFLLAGKPAGA